MPSGQPLYSKGVFILARSPREPGCWTKHPLLPDNCPKCHSVAEHVRSRTKDPGASLAHQRKGGKPNEEEHGGPSLTSLSLGKRKQVSSTSIHLFSIPIKTGSVSEMLPRPAAKTCLPLVSTQAPAARFSNQSPSLHWIIYEF